MPSYCGSARAVASNVEFARDHVRGDQRFGALRNRARCHRARALIFEMMISTAMRLATSPAL